MQETSYNEGIISLSGRKHSQSTLKFSHEIATQMK